MSLYRHLTSILTLVAIMGCGQPAVEPEPRVIPKVVNRVAASENATRIIFVGNSLTYTNDIPALVAELGNMDGREIETEMYAPGGFSLEDHWNVGEVQTAIQNRRFDFFVGQQGPSSLPESLVLLKQYANLYAAACEENNIRFALYMVWPDVTRAAFHDAVISNYTAAAADAGAVLCPAGLSWKEAWKENPHAPLYGGDGFHPSPTGSVLAALTIYGALFEKDNFNFVDHDKVSWKADVSKTDLEMLKRAALRALNQ